MDSFNERCYAILRKVPKGKVVTYKQLAEALGTRAYRAVGNAMNKNPYAPEVPCHRVVASNGDLHGFAHGLKRKAQMLKEEGVAVQNDRVDLDEFGFKL
jgi:methylated-DNA-[protein]-cysteine S-methyltransferase